MSHKKKSKSPNKPPPNSQAGVIHHYPKFLEWFGSFLTAVSAHRITFMVCLITLPVVTLAFYPSSGGDYDIWFHLAYGRHYVENLSWNIDHTQFSWPVTLSDWKYVTWIGSGLLYLAYLVGGIPGVFVLQWVIYLLVFAMLLLFIRLTGQRLELWHVLSILVMAVIHKLVGIFVKPEFFTTFFFTLVIGLYFFVRMRPERTRVLYAYPIIFLVWVNTHGGFIIGLFALTFLLALEKGASYFKRTALKKEAIRHLFWALLFSYFAILINPHGLYYHTDVFSALFSKEYMGNAKWLMAYYPLWDYVFQWPTRNINFVLAAWGTVFLGCFFASMVLYAWRKKNYIDISLIVLNICFFFFTMSAARSVIYYPVIWFFSINYLFWHCELKNLSYRLSTIALPLYLALSIFIFVVAFTMLDRKSWFGRNLENAWPKKEVNYIMENHLPGPVFNDYLIGGYMIWKMYPDYKVWIDPRWGPYVKQVLKDWFSIQDHFSTPDKLAAFRKRYPFKTALIHMAYPQIITQLMNNPDWRMAYFDKVAAVFIHVSVIPALSKSALDTSLNPDRYEDLDHPSILYNLFVFYNNFGRYFSEEIRRIYAKNVSEWYKFKDMQLQTMDLAIEQRWGKKPAATGKNP